MVSFIFSFVAAVVVVLVACASVFLLLPLAGAGALGFGQWTICTVSGAVFLMFLTGAGARCNNSSASNNKCSTNEITMATDKREYSKGKLKTEENDADTD